MEVQRDTEPKNDFLKNVRRICSKNNICLIFDECTTGFREQYGGLHLKYKVNPDIAMFGKAIEMVQALHQLLVEKSDEICERLFY